MSNITELTNEGLERKYKIVISAEEISTAIETKIEELKAVVKLPGFRPGKIPAKVVRQQYGKRIQQEVLSEKTDQTVNGLYTKERVRPATQPTLEADEYKEGSDWGFTIAFEAFPEVPEIDYAAISLEKLATEAPKAEIDERFDNLLRMHAESTPLEKERPVEKGDVATIDYKGFVDKEAFEGGEAEDFDLEIGSNSFIDTFEDQLIGSKKGDKLSIKVTFPKPYHAENLEGKEAIFEVAIKDIKTKVTPEKDDAFAEKLGLENLEALEKEIVKVVEEDYNVMARTKVKKELFDVLTDSYHYEVPQSMVNDEFDGLWKRVEHEREKDKEAFSEKSESVLQEEYRAIADRRVRLGILLSEVAKRESIDVTQPELQKALMQQAQGRPEQALELFKLSQSNPELLQSFRGPILEDKVVDFMLEKVTVKEKKVDAETLRELYEKAFEEDAESPEALLKKKKSASGANKKKKAS